MHIFNPDKLFATRIRTFRYIPGEVRPLFRQCYIGVLTLLDNLPDPAGSPTADFVYQRVLSFLTALPALLVSQVPAIGPNGVIDTIRTNCQKFLEGKWSHLYQAAIHLQALSSPPRSDDAPITPPSDERLFRMVHQLVQSGNITQPINVSPNQGYFSLILFPIFYRFIRMLISLY